MNVALQTEAQTQKQHQKRLLGKVALVTGGARGIGAAIARRLAEEGATVAFTYASSKDAAEGVLASIAEFGGTAYAFRSNAKSADDVKALISELERTVGGIDILVNNAGVYEVLPLEQVTEAHVDHIFDVNVKGVIATTAAALKLLRDGGRIINISSVAARAAVPGFGVYSASKAAVNALTRIWAQELGARKITVNAVGPGPVATDMFASVSEEHKKQFVDKTALGRVGEVEDIAAVVAFLASNDGGWITGQAIEADGGMQI